MASEQLWECYEKLYVKFDDILSYTYKDTARFLLMYKKVCWHLF